MGQNHKSLILHIVVPLCICQEIYSGIAMWKQSATRIPQTGSLFGNRVDLRPRFGSQGFESYQQRLEEKQKEVSSLTTELTAFRKLHKVSPRNTLIH